MAIRALLGPTMKKKRVRVVATFEAWYDKVLAREKKFDGVPLTGLELAQVCAAVRAARGSLLVHKGRLTNWGPNVIAELQT